jgi:hypothetical protein
MRYFAASILGCILAFAQAPGVKPPDVNPGDQCSVEGTVVNSVTGEPIKKTAVILSPVSPGTNPYGTTTDAAGHFLIDEVDAGRFRLMASHSGYIQPISAHGSPRYLAAFTLEKGQKLKEIVLNLAPQGVISGCILDEDGDPIRNVKIKCLSIFYERGKRRLEANAETKTNELGEFRVPRLSAGKYIVSATSEPNEMGQRVHERPIRSGRPTVEEAYVTTYYPSAMNPNSGSPVEVIPGAQISGIKITLLRVRSVRVKGHLTSGVASRQAGVMLVSRGEASYGDNPREVSADSKGVFQLDGVVPGSYILYAAAEVEGKHYGAKMSLEVRDANIDGIELVLEPPAEIQGRLIVEDNGDLNSKPFRLLLQSRVDNGQARWLHLQDESTFKVEEIGFEGPYDVKAGGLPGNFYVKSIRLGDQDVLQTGFEFTPGIADVLTLVLNPNGAQIEGSVQNVKDEPAIGAKVTLIPEEGHRSYGSFYKTAETDEHGRFSIRGVAPGEYKIYAWEDIEEGAHQDPDFVKAHESDGQTLSIKERGHETVQLKAIPAENAASDRPVR